MALLPAGSSFDGAAILQGVAAHLPGRGPISATDTTAAATIDGGGIGVGLIPTRIPPDDLNGPTLVAWHWPDAATAVEAHTSHVLVHAISSNVSPVELRLLHTHLVAEVLRATGALGVYIGQSMLLRSTEDFLADTATADRKNLPLLSWIGFNPVDDDGACSAYTTGLQTFGYRELEIRRSARPFSEILGRLADAAHYQIASSRELRDGDTFGETAGERRKIRFEQSAVIPDMPVAVLDF
jgi:hypothetical protein